jgi:hypothetical protein
MRYALIMILPLLGVVIAGPSKAAPQSQAGAALTGSVRSAKEGLMEGVLVSAKRNGSTITTTVVTNAQGVYSFPSERLQPGQYNVSIRAVGYVMDGPASKASVQVNAGTAAQLNLNLRDSNILELALQLTDPEWLNSFPLTAEQKYELRTAAAATRFRELHFSTYNKDQLAWVMKRMVYSAGSSPMTFQLPGEQSATWGRTEWGMPTANQKKQAEAVAAINLSEGTWKYELKKLPRPREKKLR